MTSPIDDPSSERINPIDVVGTRLTSILCFSNPEEHVFWSIFLTLIFFVGEPTIYSEVFGFITLSQSRLGPLTWKTHI